MGNPTFLLSGLIRCGRFTEWVRTHENEKEERKLWQMFLHKLGAWDERSFNEYKNDVFPEPIESASEEQLTATVKTSYDMLQDFDPEERG